MVSSVSEFSSRYKCFTFLLFLLFLSGCNDNCETVSGLPEVKVEPKRLENELFSLKSEKDVESFLDKYPSIAEAFFQKSSFPHDSLINKYLLDFYSNKELKYLQEATDSTFNNYDEWNEDLEKLFSHVKYYYPEFYIPPVYTLVTGFRFDKDIYISDSIIAVSLDYFLGDSAKYRPPFYSYFLERYKKEYVVPMIALGISNKFNQVNLEDETMLASMIFYGKAYYFVSKTIPCIHDSLLVQYNATQLKEVNENAPIIWGHFIERKLLFETKPKLIEKYVGESPKVNEIGEKCPGRIGRWVGWEIVKKYMEENKDVTLQELMAEKDAQKIFRLSKYKPAK